MAMKSAKMTRVKDLPGPDPKPAGPSKSKSKALHRDVQQMEDKWENNYVQMPAMDQKTATERKEDDLAGSERFPARLGYRDNYDSVYEMKNQLPNDSKLGYKIFTDEDAAYLIRKREAQNAANFKQVGFSFFFLFFLHVSLIHT